MAACDPYCRLQLQNLGCCVWVPTWLAGECTRCSVDVAGSSSHSRTTHPPAPCHPSPISNQTCYYAKVFEKDVPKALEILADILQVGAGGRCWTAVDCGV